MKGVEWQKTKMNARNKVGGSVNKREKKKYLDLWVSGLSEASIARAFNRDPRTVRKHLGEPIKTTLAILGPCLTNPHLNLPNRYDQGPLDLNGQNWRLDPITWFHLCVPDLREESEAYWRTDFLKFKKILEKIDFWRRDQDLRNKVDDLQKEYEKAADKLPVSQREVWERIQRERKSSFPPSRTAESPNVDWKDWLHSDDYDSVEEVVKTFSHFIPGLDERLIGLEELLQQLNDNLTEEYINKEVK